MWQGLSVTGRGDTLHLNSLYHCNKGLFTPKPLHNDWAIKLPTVSSRYGWVFIIFYCLVLHIIQDQKVSNMLKVINFNWCWLNKRSCLRLKWTDLANNPQHPYDNYEMLKVMLQSGEWRMLQGSVTTKLQLKMKHLLKGYFQDQTKSKQKQHLAILLRKNTEIL